MAYDTRATPKTKLFESRAFDGSGNNKKNKEWGKADEPLRRTSKAAYNSDGKTPSRKSPNPRTVSNIVCRSEEPPPPHKKLSNYMWAWGQYLDHEITLTPEQEDEPDHDIVAERLNMEAPKNDPDRPKGTIPFHRSIFKKGTGTGKDNPRQHPNVLSAFVDGANVYGSKLDHGRPRSDALRSGSGGKLKITPSRKHGPLLPENELGLANAHGPRQPGQIPHDKFFVAGDVRVNEHAVLVCMHTLFMREHNLLCDELAKKPSAKLKSQIKLLGEDEAIFQHARRMVSAHEQVITYEEFLPALLGKGAIPRYGGYDRELDPTIDVLFSTAPYRLGHTMLNDTIAFVKGKKVENILLQDAYFRPSMVKKRGIDGFLAGLAQQNMEQIDGLLTEAIRTHLFNVHENAPKMLLDLAALNLQRGRDHGLPDYNTCRKAYNLKPKKTFAEISSDPAVAAKLKKAYKTVGKIDPFIGGVVEDHYRRANVGEFFYTVLRDQFIRLREGDRFWYENELAFTKTEIANLKKTRLSDIIKRNTKIKDIQDNVFIAGS